MSALQAPLLLGEVFERLGDLNAALVQYNRLILLQPDFALAHKLLGYCFCFDPPTRMQNEESCVFAGRLRLAMAQIAYGKACQTQQSKQSPPQKSGSSQGHPVALIVYAHLKQAQQVFCYVAVAFDFVSIFYCEKRNAKCEMRCSLCQSLETSLSLENSVWDAHFYLGYVYLFLSGDDDNLQACFVLYRVSHKLKRTCKRLLFFFFIC